MPCFIPKESTAGLGSHLQGRLSCASQATCTALSTPPPPVGPSIQPRRHTDVSGRHYKGSNSTGSERCAKKPKLFWSTTASSHPRAPFCPSWSPAHPRLSLGKDSFGFQSLFQNDGCFFPFLAGTNVFPQKMGTQIKPPFPKGIFFLNEKSKKPKQHSAWEWAECCS